MGTLRKDIVLNQTGFHELTNDLEIRLEQRVFDDDVMLGHQWIRLVISPGEDPDARLRDISNAFGQPVETESALKLRQHVKREHTQDVIQKYKNRNNSPQAQPGLHRKTFVHRSIVDETDGSVTFQIADIVSDGDKEISRDDFNMRIDPIDDTAKVLLTAIQQLEDIKVDTSSFDMNRMKSHLDREFTKKRIDVANDKRLLKVLRAAQAELEQKEREAEAQRLRDIDEAERKAAKKKAQENVR